MAKKLSQRKRRKDFDVQEQIARLSVASAEAIQVLSAGNMSKKQYERIMHAFGVSSEKETPKNPAKTLTEAQVRFLSTTFSRDNLDMSGYALGALRFAGVVLVGEMTRNLLGAFGKKTQKTLEDLFRERELFIQEDYLQPDWQPPYWQDQGFFDSLNLPIERDYYCFDDEFYNNLSSLGINCLGQLLGWTEKVKNSFKKLAWVQVYFRWIFGGEGAGYEGHFPLRAGMLLPPNWTPPKDQPQLQTEPESSQAEDDREDESPITASWSFGFGEDSGGTL